MSGNQTSTPAAQPNNCFDNVHFSNYGHGHGSFPVDSSDSAGHFSHAGYGNNFGNAGFVDLNAFHGTTTFFGNDSTHYNVESNNDVGHPVGSHVGDSFSNIGSESGEVDSLFGEDASNVDDESEHGNACSADDSGDDLPDVNAASSDNDFFMSDNLFNSNDELGGNGSDPVQDVGVTENLSDSWVKDTGTFFDFDAFDAETSEAQLQDAINTSLFNAVDDQPLPYEDHHGLPESSHAVVDAFDRNVAIQLTDFLAAPSSAVGHSFQEHLASDGQLGAQYQHAREQAAHNQQHVANDHCGSDTETLVDQPQSATLGDYCNINQYQQQAQFGGSFRAGTKQAQRRPDATKKVTMSEYQLEGLRRHLATELQRPGMSEQAKFTFLASIPDHIMMHLKRAHPMPATQGQKTAQSVPKQVPQQPIASTNAHVPPALDMFARPPPTPTQGQEVARPVSNQAPQQRSGEKKQATAPSQPKVPAARATSKPSSKVSKKTQRTKRAPAPAPLGKGKGSLRHVMAEQWVDSISPTPSASSVGSLNGASYQPLINHIQPAMVEPCYPAYTGYFRSGGQARRWRERARIAPKITTDSERVKQFGRQYWVQHLYTSMVDCTDYIDGNNSVHAKRMERPFWPAQELEAACHDIFDQAIQVHELGWNRPLAYWKKTVRGKLVDSCTNSLEARLSQICDVLRTSKAVVDDCMRSGITLALVVDNPTARIATKISNNSGNDKRGDRLALVTKIEKKQGFALTAKQLDAVNTQFPELAHEEIGQETTAGASGEATGSE
ncbi:hypothetical protein ACEQ8H_007887 [Pleosporales sp. CAS-2024a]